jgi:aryl sulfotransferase
MYAILNDEARPGAELPRCPEDPRELWPRWIREGWFDWEPDGWPFWSHHHHLSTWWDVRDLPNVLFVHYGDLQANADAEIRRIAGFCDIEIDEHAWPALLESIGLDAMRTEARGADDPMQMAFEGGAARFFFKGGAGRWRSVLTDTDLELYETAAATLAPGLRTWLEGGRHAIA